MKHPLTKSAASLCLEFGEDDGIDPRYLNTNHFAPKSARKNLQLCKEAARVIALVLSGETGQPLLRDLQVLSVQPEGDGQSLCVTVGHYADDHSASEAQVLAALKAVQGLLRCALAQAIHRKQTPGLRFRYLGTLGKGAH